MRNSLCQITTRARQKLADLDIDVYSDIFELSVNAPVRFVERREKSVLAEVVRENQRSEGCRFAVGRRLEAG